MLDSNLVRHAMRELDILGYPLIEHFDTQTKEFDPDMEVRKNILELVTVFAKQHHSGFSASFVTSMMAKLLRFQTLSPITNNPDEWNHVGEEQWGEPGGIWQNARDGAMFSTNGGKTYYSVNDRTWFTPIYHKFPKNLRKWVWNKHDNWLHPIHTSKEYTR